MNDKSPFLIIVQSYDEALAWVTHRLSSVGLQVMRTFDLQAARHAHTDCPCPHHGTEQCDCQMVVLLVYGSDDRPISMVAHSFDGRTTFSLVDTPQQRADPHLEAAIMRALLTQSLAPSDQLNLSHAT
jgi:predicted alpha/beta-hydrolase family hydrolase